MMARRSTNISAKTSNAKKTIAGEGIDQQAGANANNKDGCQQTQQPHERLGGRLGEPARYATRGVLRLFEGGNFPAILLLEQGSGQLVVHRVATFVR
jgi:hypothetical protein